MVLGSGTVHGVVLRKGCDVLGVLGRIGFVVYSSERAGWVEVVRCW